MATTSIKAFGRLKLEKTRRVSESPAMSVTPYHAYAVAVIKPESSTIVGHVPRKTSAICSLFLRKWLANATNSAFSVQHALWFISTTPILLCWWDCACSS